MISTHRLRVQSRRLDRLNAAATTVLHAMRDGLALQAEFGVLGPRWRLSNGRFVTGQVARIVINHPEIVGVGDALFVGATQQTIPLVRKLKPSEFVGRRKLPAVTAHDN